MFVAPSVRTRASVLLMPCIWTKNSVLILLAASLSESPRVLHKASICSRHERVVSFLSMEASSALEDLGT